jgi:hypothetical protein
MCRDCKKLYNVTNHAIERSCEERCGGREQFRAKPKQERVQIRAAVIKSLTPTPTREATPALNLRLPSVPREALPKSTRDDTIDGYIYAVVNRAWPGYVKIGYATDCQKRLSQYQTGSPFKDYRMDSQVYVSDKRKAEAFLHQHFDLHCATDNEWFKVNITTVRRALKDVAEVDPYRST